MDPGVCTHCSDDMILIKWCLSYFKGTPSYSSGWIVLQKIMVFDLICVYEHVKLDLLCPYMHLEENRII